VGATGAAISAAATAAPAAAAARFVLAVDSDLAATPALGARAFLADGAGASDPVASSAAFVALVAAIAALTAATAAAAAAEAAATALSVRADVAARVVSVEADPAAAPAAAAAAETRREPALPVRTRRVSGALPTTCPTDPSADCSATDPLPSVTSVAGSLAGPDWRSRGVFPLVISPNLFHCWDSV
jgi:hypothetical protein